MERTPPRLDVFPLVAPSQQVEHVEILHSNERPGVTPLFGTPCPPRGVSGATRRLAFRHSENDLRHWLLLLLADRIDVGEGIVEDLSQGHVPNIFREMGGAAELKYNRVGAARKALVAATVLGILYLSVRRRRDRKLHSERAR
jgi:hypothetical protein